MTQGTTGGAMSINEIMERLPHRYPFLLVDRVLETVPGKFIRAVKNVTINEAFFAGHFPGFPVMPGVLIIEALAQTAAILSFMTMNVKPDQNSVVYVVRIDHARFKPPVGPAHPPVARPLNCLAHQAQQLLRELRQLGRTPRAQGPEEERIHEPCSFGILAAEREVGLDDGFERLPRVAPALDEPAHGFGLARPPAPAASAVPDVEVTAQRWLAEGRVGDDSVAAEGICADSVP